MGLDLAELAICVEEEFGIAFDENNSVWHKWAGATFGDVADEVRRLLAEKKIQSDGCGVDCRYETVLPELQNFLKEMFPQRNNVSETERIARIVPYWKQSKHLAVIKKRFPEIIWKERSWIVNTRLIFALTFFLIFLGCFVTLPISLPFLVSQLLSFYFDMPVIGCFCILTFIGACGLTLIQWFPPIGTIGDYAQQIVDNRQRTAAKRQQWNEWLETDDVQIEAVLRQIFADTLALKPEVIKRESRLRKDLHIG